MKFIFFAAFLYPVSIFAQTAKPLSLADCYNLAKQQYPLAKKKELINTSELYSVENASKTFYPQVNVFGQASYQSDVTEVPIKLPNANIPTISKDQYKVYAEVSQLIFDGGVNKLQQHSIHANAAVEKQQLEVELYKLRDRVSQLYFGILLLNEQLVQSGILKNDIQLGLNKTNAAIANGIALRSNGEILQAELLKHEQRITELKSTRKSYIEMLGQFINQPLDTNTILEKPIIASVSNSINRPELLFYDQQQKLTAIKKDIIHAKNLPKISLFMQGGYGRPALNMLKNDFSGYYIGGIRFGWNLSGLYTAKKEKAIADLDNRTVEIQRETFLFNTKLQLKQQEGEISKLEELIQSDKAIIELRTHVKNTSLVQLENGVITSSDYLREVNAENQAIQNQSMHEIQLLMAKYNQQNITGN